MTGSGACVFAEFAAEREARALHARAAGGACGVSSRGGWTQHPLREWAEIDPKWGVAKLVKAPDFDSGIRGFESFLPSHNIATMTTMATLGAARQPDGVHRQRQPAPRAGGGEAPEHPARPRHGRQVQRRRGDGRDAGERARQGRVRAAVDLRADQRQPDGAAGDGGRAEALVGGARHGGDPVLRLRAPGPAAALGAGRHQRQGGGEHAGRGRRGPRADDGSARRPDPGVLRHPGGQHLRGADPAGRRVEAGLREPGRGVARRRRRGARARAREAARVGPRDHRQAAPAAERRRGDEHHRRGGGPHLRDHGRHGRHREHAVRRRRRC